MSFGFHKEMPLASWVSASFVCTTVAAWVGSCWIGLHWLVLPLRVLTGLGSPSLVADRARVSRSDRRW